MSFYISQVVISADNASPLLLSLAPEKDYLILAQEAMEVEINPEELDVIVAQGKMLLGQFQEKKEPVLQTPPDNFEQKPDHLPAATEMVDTRWSGVCVLPAPVDCSHSWAEINPVELGLEPAPPAQKPPQSVPPAEIFPVEYADSDGDGIRILMEPADETGRVCWVVRNSRHVNPCHEFPSPEDAYAAHRRAQPAPALPAPAGELVKRVAILLANRFSMSSPGNDCKPFARDVIREVGEWLEGQRGLAALYYGGLLREEAER